MIKTTLNFAQISDIHINRHGNHADVLGGQAADFLAAIIEQLEQQPDLDFVLFSGDLVDNAHPEEFNMFEQQVRRLTVPYYIIPGNHDRRAEGDSEGLTRHDFAQRYNAQVYQRPPQEEAQAGYWSVTIKPGLQLIGLDSIRDANWGGIIDTIQRAWLRKELHTHRDKFVILTSHHPFQSNVPITQLPKWRWFVCDNGPEILTLLDESPQVKLVLTGHQHLAKATQLGQRLHLACPSTSIYPCAYRTIRLTPQAKGGWLLNWQTHPATAEETRDLAKQMMIDAWLEAGLAEDFIAEHVQLARGNSFDRAGQLQFTEEAAP